MRKARAAASKPRARAKPRAKPSPVSLVSGGSSPSAGTASLAADLSFLCPSSSPVAKPRTRTSPLAASPAFAAPAGMSTVGDLRSLAASHLDSLKRRLDALHGASDSEGAHGHVQQKLCEPRQNNNSGRSQESFVTVRLPGGIRRMKNLEELCHVDVSKNTDVLAEITQLLQLRKLGVVIHGKKFSLVVLFQQIDILHSCLRSLSIQINQQSTREQINPNTAVIPASVSPPKLLESLNISGTVGRLSNWIKEHGTLTKVTLRNTLLEEHDIHILGGLKVLQYLRLRNDSYKEGELSFRKENFQSLKSLVVEGTIIISISFEDGAAPKLERIVWSFTSMQSLSGIQHLQKLKELELNGSGDLDPVRQAIKEHPNHPMLKT
ncbi:hypothetical protein EJB05_09497, partial [Eragrostis curvula]